MLSINSTCLLFTLQFTLPSMLLSSSLADEKFLQGSSDMPYEAEFVTNPLSAYVGGPEDSSWLADVDNNEAYENDDYALAGEQTAGHMPAAGFKTLAACYGSSCHARRARMTATPWQQCGELGVQTSSYILQPACEQQLLPRRIAEATEHSCKQQWGSSTTTTLCCYQHCSYCAEHLTQLCTVPLPAGIPEAAPKVKRQQREEVEETSEEELRAVEDEKISAAAFDDIEGFQDDADAGARSTTWFQAARCAGLASFRLASASNS
jgi:hypothetical protein